MNIKYPEIALCFDEIFIPGLVETEKTGRFSRIVLLQIQEYYVRMVLNEQREALAKFCQASSESTGSSSDFHREGKKLVKSLVIALYESEKQGMKGIGLTEYLDHAHFIYGLHIHLHENSISATAEAVKFCSVHHCPPPLILQSLAYIALSKLSGVYEVLEGVGGETSAKPAEIAILEAVRSISALGTQGRELLHRIESIAEDPQQLVEIKSASEISPGWEFDLLERDFEELSF